MKLQAPALTALAAARATRLVANTKMAATPYWHYKATEKSKGSIILVHGYRGTHEGLAAIVGALPDFDCYVPDLPGFGESPPFKVLHSIENYAQWLAEFEEKLALKGNVTMFAHSFGTIVVGAYASTHSTPRLVLVNPVSAPALSGPRTVLSQLSRIYYRLAANLPSGAGRWLLSMKPIVWLVTEFMFIGKDKALKTWVDNQHQTYFSRFATTKTAAEGFDASISHNLSEYAGDISSNVLLICAQQDDITSIQQQREAAELYKNATYVELENVGHLTHYQCPNELAEHTRDFILVQG